MKSLRSLGLSLNLNLSTKHHTLKFKTPYKTHTKILYKSLHNTQEDPRNKTEKLAPQLLHFHYFIKSTKLCKYENPFFTAAPLLNIFKKSHHSTQLN